MEMSHLELSRHADGSSFLRLGGFLSVFSASLWFER
jgi:hypothetical protein